MLLQKYCSRISAVHAAAAANTANQAAAAANTANQAAACYCQLSAAVDFVNNTSANGP